MHIKSHLAGLLFATIFGFTFMFSKVALEYVVPMGLIAYRFLVAFIFFEVLRRLKLVRIRFDKSLIKPVFWVVFFQPVLYFLFEIFGLNLVTSAEAGMMIALIPVFGAMMSGVVLKEPVKPIQWVFIIMSVSGILYIQVQRLQSGFEGALLGYVLLFLAVLSAAAFNLASRSASVRVQASELTYFMMMVGAVVFNAIFVVQLIIENRLEDYVLNLMVPQNVMPILYLGVVASVGGFFLVNYALRALTAPVASIYANLATVVSILAGAFILNEPLFRYHAIGSVIILVGVYGTVYHQRKARLNGLRLQRSDMS